MLEIEGITKSFGSLNVLRGITLDLTPGIFGLLGPNGAGKSTLMRTLATLLTPDSGRITLKGEDALKNPQAMRQALGYLPQSFGVYPKVTAQGLLHHIAILKGLTRKGPRQAQIESLLKAVNLWDKRRSYVAQFSGGMLKRFGVAQALLGDPKILIVDEPTAGLDLYERQRLLDLLAEASQDKIIILSTHITADIRDLCDDMAIFAEGQILRRASPRALIDELEGQVWQRQVSKEEIDPLTQAHQVLSTQMRMGAHHIRVLAQAPPGPEFQAASPQLDDAYFATLYGFGGA